MTLLVTMGDPAGIGIDITLKALNAPTCPPFTIIGEAAIYEKRAKHLNLTLPKTTQFIALKNKVKSETPHADNAAAIIESIEVGVAMIKNGTGNALVTNPIAKYILMQAGFKHAGHTEFLGELATKHWHKPVTPVMLLWSEELAVIPITVHIPLKDVPHKLTKQLILDTVNTAARDYAARFKIASPRLAFCGLNPHAGDEGMMGKEEQTLILPAIEELKSQGLNITGVHAADTLFHKEARMKYDLAFGMYHDQVLIPMKTLAFDEGVNVTLGLPFVRTSPDHGTAFDIAGTGKARATSFIEAVKLAAKIL